MASCPPRLPGQALLQEWGWAHSDSTSPTSSSDSYSLSPSSSACQALQEPLRSCPPEPASTRPLQHRADPCHSSRGAQGRAGGGQRQSASEREKLRMRNLSKALHTLRRYLPPSVVPAGQSLTKIETLRLACRYISHLAELLGLSEETLAQRREGPRRRCRLCPEGLGCCQARSPSLQPASPAQREGPPPATERWMSPACCPAAGAPPELTWVESPEAASWVTPTYCFETGTPPELCGAQLSDLRAWGPPTTHSKAGSFPEPHSRWITDAQSWGPPHRCADPPDSSGIEATPARPWMSPTHCTLLSALHQADPVCPAQDWSTCPRPQPAHSHPRGVRMELAQPQEQRDSWS